MRITGSCEDAGSQLLEIGPGVVVQGVRANMLLFRFLVLMEFNTQSSSWSDMV